LINTHNGYKNKDGRIIERVKIENYKSVKKWLDEGGIAYNGKIYRGYEQIAKRDDQGDTPYNLRSCSYMEDFYKQKIVYSEIVKEPQFYLDNNGEFFAEATSFIMTGKHLEYLIILLHSKLITYAFKTFYAGAGLGNDGYRYKKTFLELLPIVIPNEKIKKELENSSDKENYIYQLYDLSDEEINCVSLSLNS
jgi:site-specific DNA-methyltransferase (adenine-specific)